MWGSIKIIVDLRLCTTVILLYHKIQICTSTLSPESPIVPHPKGVFYWIIIC